MVQERSFTQYLKTEYKNELFAASEHFLLDNYEDMDLFSHSVKQIDSIQLDDITIKQVYVEDSDNMTPVFDVLVETEVLIQEVNRHYDYDDSLYSWLRIRCTGKLESGLKEKTSILPLQRWGETMLVCLKFSTNNHLEQTSRVQCGWTHFESFLR